MALVIAAALGAYLIGSIPFGVLMARLCGVDLRQVGSGNIGATNAARALGKPLGVVVLLCDAAKAYVPVVLTRHVVGRWQHGAWVVSAVALAAFLGHLYPLWNRFRGGKGVATGLGIFVALDALAALVAVAAWGGVYAFTRLSSLGSLVATAALLATLLWRHHPPAVLALALILALLIVWRHRSNIGRLLHREEKKV